LQHGTAIGAIDAEYLGQRQIVEVRRMLELRTALLLCQKLQENQYYQWVMGTHSA
jgi:DNA-binding GntR family transcriptional regulator